MSRIGNKHIELPTGVEVKKEEGNVVSVKGPKGSLANTFSTLIEIINENNVIILKRANEQKHTKQLHGTTRALLNNMVVGVSEGFSKELKIQGIGYRAMLQGTTLVMNMGYSHQVKLEPLPGVEISLKSPTEITVSGIDKQAVGQMAALIREVRKPEPYGGKGIMYTTEKIRRKVGKKAGKK